MIVRASHTQCSLPCAGGCVNNRVAAKIRAGTTEETTKAQLNLFSNIKSACHVEAEEAAVPEEEEESADFFSWVSGFFTNIFGVHEILAGRDDDISYGVRSADKKLKAIISSLEKSDGSLEQEAVIQSEITAVNESMTKILSALK